MHESVLAFLRRVVDRQEIEGKSVLEVGSYFVNGSAREVIEPLRPTLYVGLDMREGPGVDLVRDICTLTAPAPVFDAIVCCEVLEHVENWRMAVTNMKALLNITGTLYVTTRSLGFALHEYPSDFWRYGHRHFQEIFSDLAIERLETDQQAPGVFMKARRSSREIRDLSQIEVDPVR